MKKLVSLLLAVSMLLAVYVAFAAEGEIELDKSVTTGTTTVSLTVDSTADNYIVTIPSAVVIDPLTQCGYGTITLRAGWELVSVNEIDLAISNVANGVKDQYPNLVSPLTDSNYQNFTMTSNTGNSTTYAIRASTLHAPMAEKQHIFVATGNITHYYSEAYNSTLISATKGQNNTSDKTCELTFYVESMPEAGVYTDTLTFAITTK